jgi:ABC-type sugar transport system ATPase subunit
MELARVTSAAGPASAGRAASIAVRGIFKRFGATQALDGVDVDIAPASIHAFVGENGAGKSTLGKIIAGVIRPDAGTLTIDGERMSYRSPHEALAAGVTMMAQELCLVPYLSVLDNVFLGCESHRLGALAGEQMKERYRELAERLRISLPATAPAGTLRVADQQKVEVMRAVARDARILIMDEPTAALTPNEARVLFDAVLSLREAGTTVIYVSHYLDEVLRLSDDLTVLRNGRVVRSGPTAAETRGSLVTGMVGRAIDLTMPPKQFPAPDAPVVCSVRGLSTPDLLDDVSFDVRAGEIVALTGLVGSGRSEVGRAIFGADKRYEGEIAINGRVQRFRHPHEAVRHGVAMLPESRKDQGLFLDRSVKENMTIAGLGRVSWGGFVNQHRENAEVARLVEEFGIKTADLDVAVAALSGGNQQKALLARWAFVKPDLLIADEPTRGVDVGAKRGIYGLLHELAAQGMGLLLISSEIDEVLGLAHRVLVMRSGMIAASLDGGTTTELEILSAGFGHVEEPVI